ALQVGFPQRARHGPLRNHRLDHGREQEAEGQWPEDLPEHVEGDLKGMQDRANHEQFDLAPHQPLDRVVELADLLASAAAPDRLRDTMLGVVGEQLESDALECGPRGVDLGEDIDAVPILLDHLLDTAYLALDAP